MICPSCGKLISNKFPNNEKISSSIMHFYGTCQYCKEIVHFVSDSLEKFTYGWSQSKELKYRLNISKLQKKKFVLFVNKSSCRLFDICLKFNKKFGSNVGFLVLEEYKQQAKSINNVYDIITLDNILFPTTPSFLAEKFVFETIPGKLFSLGQTITSHFEVWND